MSRPHDGHRANFPFGNPFRMILPKGSYLSPKLLALLNSFEETLAESLRKLKPKDNSDVLSLSWMRHAMESLSVTHTNIKSLITDLQFPVSDWDEKWMDMYLDNSVKLLDICIALSSELSRLDQGQLLLHYVLHLLDTSSNFLSSEQLKRAHASLHDWTQQINARNPKLENCSAILQDLAGTLYLAKAKNSAKGKVLMRALYGVKVETIFVCSIFTAAFSGLSKPLTDLHVTDKFLWAEAFNDLQANVNGEIRRQFSSGKVVVLKELEAVDMCVEKLRILTSGVDFKEEEQLGIGHKEVETSGKAIVQEETEGLGESVSDLAEKAEVLAHGLDLVSKQVGDFFQIVLTGRDALLGNLRLSDITHENYVEESRL